MDNYRNILSFQGNQRPTLDELHDASITNKVGRTFNKGEMMPFSHKQKCSKTTSRFALWVGPTPTRPPRIGID